MIEDAARVPKTSSPTGEFPRHRRPVFFSRRLSYGVPKERYAEGRESIATRMDTALGPLNERQKTRGRNFEKIYRKAYEYRMCAAPKDFEGILLGGHTNNRNLSPFPFEYLRPSDS